MTYNINQLLIQTDRKLTVKPKRFDEVFPSGEDINCSIRICNEQHIFTWGHVDPSITKLGMHLVLVVVNPASHVVPSKTTKLKRQTFEERKKHILGNDPERMHRVNRAHDERKTRLEGIAAIGKKSDDML